MAVYGTLAFYGVVSRDSKFDQMSVFMFLFTVLEKPTSFIYIFSAVDAIHIYIVALLRNFVTSFSSPLIL